MRILIVEDDPDTRALLSAVLARCASLTDTASDGEGAIRAVQSTTYDVVILDLMLPKANGFEVAAVARKAIPRPKLVVVSALARHFEDRFEPGTVMLQKPLDIERISDLLRSFTAAHGAAMPPAGAALLADP
jgi:DNA-binding response OmpR family regulator